MLIEPLNLRLEGSLVSFERVVGYRSHGSPTSVRSYFWSYNHQTAVARILEGRLSIYEMRLDIPKYMPHHIKGSVVLVTIPRIVKSLSAFQVVLQLVGIVRSGALLSRLRDCNRVRLAHSTSMDTRFLFPIRESKARKQ